MKFEDRDLAHDVLSAHSSERPLLVHHVARLTGYSRRMVRHLAQTGEFPAFKLGKKIWGFDRAQIANRGRQ
jgi:predicted DNA-binding transcriptional regulator AlpA